MPKRPATPAKLDHRNLMQDAAITPSATASALARFAIAAAPDILRTAERFASQRAQQNRVTVSEPLHPRIESLQLSEVEIDFSVPFVRKLTMRNATAWAVSPPAPVAPPDPVKRGPNLKTVGLVGIGSAAALAAGLLAHYADQRFGARERIIDVPGRRKD